MGQIVPSSKFQTIDHMPCQCGGTRWLRLIEPAQGGLPLAAQDAGLDYTVGHDIREYECPRCQKIETIVVRFK